MFTRIFTSTLLAASFALASAAAAHAGRYHVYACRTPAGTSAPADGWSGTVAAGGAWDDYATNTCQGGGALVAALGDQTTHMANVDRATWSFDAPSFAHIVGATLWRAGSLHGRPGDRATYQFWLAAPIRTEIIDECIFTAECSGKGDQNQPRGGPNMLAVPAANLGGSLYVNVSCGLGATGSECSNAFHDPNGYAAVVYVYAADVMLEQTAGPSASNVSGELAGATAVSGTSDVAFSASDPGAGVYQAVFSVDGRVVQSTVIDSNGGRCGDVGGAGDGTAAFEYIQPCPASTSADVGFDTTRVANGVHHVIVSVLDAAGNAAPVLDRNVTIANPLPAGTPGPANGSNASSQATLTVSWKGSRRARVAGAYGRAHTIDGRVTAPGGVPIAGALVEVTATPAFAGARPAAMRPLLTAADGRFALRLPGSVSSRSLRLAYRAHVGDALPAAARTLSLTVAAGIVLSVTPRTAGVGRSIAFRGRLLGGLIPRAGKQLVLEARSPGGPWIEFDVVRADTRGRYRARYRFRFAGPADYQFRVRSEGESDYPFAAGSSNVVGVHER